MKVTLFHLTNVSFLLTVAFGWNLSQSPNGKVTGPPSLFAVNSLVRSPSTTEPGYDHDTFRTGDRLSNMIPLSNPPLLLLQSSSPIISRQECNLLCQYFEQQEPNLNTSNHPVLDKNQIRQAEDILCNVRHVIDKLTNCPSHLDEMPVPRYIRYDAKLTSRDILQSPDFVNVLLPDGLHVDTNNGKLFRHITAILYLTDNGFADDGKTIVAGGGTSFPLAVPFGSHRDNTRNAAANNLLSRGIHHTKADGDQCVESDGRNLEKLSIDAYCRDLEHCLGLSMVSGDQIMSERGIRVMPSAGKLIYFHNVGDDGTPDPTSFHGGEELAVISDQSELDLNTALQHKSILVFFKEIPVEKIEDFQSFVTEVNKAREWTVKEYYSY
ncbi:hypothetical protein HJC23_011275 [Cyclotella cryptica]|uniref:Fe2OG dioxygenase domain-containing protein n=1 Tax=Cyclotella cryptica TaxID=29204 RepID=A0ABD3QVK4_9STRA|eukprot:CCRYP_001670-RA/>CCRYP_001670-RA protein AED:0.05 eAED:0.04 QI:0/-1/0/1/-1/1/1/0/380